tara:strand:- start:230 stop:721 length:492 start_codon:yes stop_codon:yes gene_type:complete
MTEALKQTPEPDTNFDQHADEAIELGNQPQQELRRQQADEEAILVTNARDAASRLLQAPEQPKRLGAANTLVRVGVGLGLGASAIAGGVAVGDAITPDASTEKKTYVVQPGDGLYDVANSIPGADKLDQRDVIDSIASDPANISALKDGLQPGETLVVPVEYK